MVLIYEIACPSSFVCRYGKLLQTRPVVVGDHDQCILLESDISRFEPRITVTPLLYIERQAGDERILILTSLD